MTRVFKRGDRVRIIKSPPPCPYAVGTIATVISDGYPKSWDSEVVPAGTTVYPLDLGRGVAFPGEFLEPFWDGKEVSGSTCEEILRQLRASTKQTAGVE